MKKIALFSLMPVLMPCLSFGGTVTEACYATKHCGARDSLMWSIAGGVTGFAAGGTAGTIVMPILGSWVGAYYGASYGAKLGGKIGHAYTANEYLYFDNGYCLECDTHQIGEDYECPNGSIVTNGDKAFKCITQTTGDFWREYEIPLCSDSPIKSQNSSEYENYKVQLKDNITNNGKVVHDGVLAFSGAVCKYVTGEKKQRDDVIDPIDPVNPRDCKAGEERATKNINGINGCTGDKCTPIVSGRCYDRKFLRCMEAIDSGLKVTWNIQRCICTDDGKEFDYETRTCGGGNDPVEKSCKERRATAEGKACCDIPANEAIWANHKCNCLNGKEFKIENGRGQCVDKNGPVPPVSPVVPDEESDCYYTFDVDINCSNGTKYTAGQRVKLKKEQVAQLGGCNATSAQIQSIEDIIANIQREYTAAANLMLLICGNSSATIQPNGPSAGELSDATRTLESFASNASSQASVWKDADGKFNTARLASDLTAGVVLGTVGGVVSGVVIKKKQVEKGFDALHCTVGGQKIADWGDTFSVGLQK